MITKSIYDVQLSFDPRYDERPSLLVFKVYEDAQGDYIRITDYAPDETHLLTKQQEDELARNLNLEDLYDTFLEEMFTTEEMPDYLPESVKARLAALPAYEIEKEEE